MLVLFLKKHQLVALVAVANVTNIKLFPHIALSFD
jgi:hypothetical protein